MKSIQLFLLAFLPFHGVVFAQINMFPQSGNVGIGTQFPSALLTLETPDPVIRLKPTGGVFGRTSSIDFGGTFSYAGNGDAGTRIFAKIRAGSDQNGAWDTAYLSILGNHWDNGAPSELLRINTASGNVGIGTTNPAHKLAVNGTIKAKELIVETAGWSDYVLARNYKLQSLADVETHINDNGRLPGIPSAAQVATEGVSVGEMQARLLAKVEELTLHIIAQEKKMASLQTRLEQLESR